MYVSTTELLINIHHDSTKFFKKQKPPFQRCKLQLRYIGSGQGLETKSLMISFEVWAAVSGNVIKWGNVVRITADIRDM